MKRDTAYFFGVQVEPSIAKTLQKSLELSTALLDFYLNPMSILTINRYPSGGFVNIYTLLKQKISKMVGWIKKLFSKNKNQEIEHSPKARPADWKFTLDDLFAEMEAGKRKSVGSPEADWAREYELELLPEGIRFAKKGDLYEALEDQTISYLTAWAAPFTGGGEAVLFKGERIWIDGDPRDEKALGSYAVPVDYDALEKRMVPEAERNDPQYGGFYFFFKTAELHEKFALIGTSFETETRTPRDRAAPSPASISHGALRLPRRRNGARSLFPRAIDLDDGCCRPGYPLRPWR